MTTYVSLSGGLDSTAALALIHLTDVAAVSFDYGQRHRRELQAAASVAGHYQIEHRILDLRGLLHGSALLGETEVPEGHYAEETMRATVVQGRNLLFVAAAIATMEPGDALVVGVHAGDHPIYPDCRPAFWDHLGEAVTRAYDVRIAAPFLEETKAEVVRLGSEAGAPFQLTWSCYEGGRIHCGRCGTCVERAEAFHLAGIEDPTEYADPDYWRAVTA
jgi:7-cyano-7-deazaguanine synthase